MIETNGIVRNGTWSVISLYVKFCLIMTGLNICQLKMKTSFILHLWYTLFEVFLIQLNAKAYCMIFDCVVLFCSVCCFICWFMLHNKSIWQEKRLRPSRGAKDCCNKEAEFWKACQLQSISSTKANWFDWNVFWYRCTRNWHPRGVDCLWISIVYSCLFGERVKTNVPLACAKGFHEMIC